jgi:hypothetical protein
VQSEKRAARSAFLLPATWPGTAANGSAQQ